MNVLMVGSGAGSFEVRGKQLGLQMGARVTRQPSSEDLRWADVVVVIKRAIKEHAEAVHEAGKPLVWDALDFWQQPGQNGLNETEAQILLDSWIARYRPNLVVGATEAMAKAARGVYLPHHSRPGLTPLPCNPEVTTVAYEGTRKYLGKWGRAIQQECDKRGWTFVINPQDLRYADIVVAFRDGEWDGWMCREWKSGVKIVNAIAAGRPIVTQTSAALRELASVGSSGAVVSDEKELGDAFDGCSFHHNGKLAASVGDNQFSLSRIAARYLTILQGVAEKVAA